MYSIEYAIDDITDLIFFFYYYYYQQYYNSLHIYLYRYFLKKIRYRPSSRKRITGPTTIFKTGRLVMISYGRARAVRFNPFPCGGPARGIRPENRSVFVFAFPQYYSTDRAVCRPGGSDRVHVRATSDARETFGRKTVPAPFDARPSDILFVSTNPHGHASADRLGARRNRLKNGKILAPTTHFRTGHEKKKNDNNMRPWLSLFVRILSSIRWTPVEYGNGKNTVF